MFHSRKPVRRGDQYETRQGSVVRQVVEVWLGRLGGASMELCFELYSPTHVEPRVLFVRSTTTLVTISAETGSPVRIPEQVRAAWADYIEEPIRFTRR